MRIQLLLLILTAFIVDFGLTTAQTLNQMENQPLTNRVNDEGKTRENFQHLLDSIAKNNPKRSEVYHEILKQNVAKERQTFDAMKERLWTARNRNSRKKFNFFKKSNIEENISLKKRAIVVHSDEIENDLNNEEDENDLNDEGDEKNVNGEEEETNSPNEEEEFSYFDNMKNNKELDNSSPFKNWETMNSSSGEAKTRKEVEDGVEARLELLLTKGINDAEAMKKECYEIINGTHQYEDRNQPESKSVTSKSPASMWTTSRWTKAKFTTPKESKSKSKSKKS